MEGRRSLETQGKSSRGAGNKCFLPHCRRTRREYPGLRFFKFPEFGTPLYKKWAELCNCYGTKHKVLIPISNSKKCNSKFNEVS